MNKFIDPKNPNTVGKSVLNLGNHILVICFILALLFVVKVSCRLVKFGDYDVCLKDTVVVVIIGVVVYVI
jgi:hypothetical protein